MKLINTRFCLADSFPAYMATGDALEKYALKNEEGLLFYHPPWAVTLKYAITLKRKISSLNKKGKKVIVCCNEKRDVIVLSKLGIKAHLLNQNMHLPEQLFTPVDNPQILYDAIYIAQASKFKRISLAKEIKKLYVLTYRCKNTTKSGDYDLHAYAPEVSHCDFNSTFITSENEISKLISNAYCGLALSKKEGAMWASMEYLMCGRPVVTTHNRGGRNHYFHRDFALFVKATPEAVANGVNTIKEWNLSSHEVRRSVLKEVKKDRFRFLEVLNYYLRDCGIERTNYDFIWGGDRGIYTREMPILTSQN